ncbi:hypothetical protein ACHAWF_003106 [Thalassiosira exigua]
MWKEEGTGTTSGGSRHEAHVLADQHRRLRQTLPPLLCPNAPLQKRRGIEVYVGKTTRFAVSALQVINMVLWNAYQCSIFVYTAELSTSTDAQTGYNARYRTIYYVSMLAFLASVMMTSTLLGVCSVPLRLCRRHPRVEAGGLNRGPEYQAEMYGFAVVWGVCLSWIHPTHVALYSTTIPCGRETKLMGIYIFAGCEEAGMSMAVGLVSLNVFFVGGFVMIMWIGDFDTAPAISWGADDSTWIPIDESVSRLGISREHEGKEHGANGLVGVMA